MPTSIEICAGAGGQALGLERAGFYHRVLVEIEHDACKTLRYNRPNWLIKNMDVKEFSAVEFCGIDLLAGGVPCPPFSIAGKQLGKEDERDLFPEALRLVKECQPKAVMLENVKGLFAPKFDEYRGNIIRELESMGYRCVWRLINSSDYGVSQLRPRTILVALREPYASHFTWPEANADDPQTVGQLLFEEMSQNGWLGASEWATNANTIAPTLVGGSKKHGGPDLGPTRAKRAWAELGVDGKGIADKPPARDFRGVPKLTVQMAALVQGFPRDWKFVGSKTTAYRQVGNAFPPPVAEAIGKAIVRSIDAVEKQGSYSGCEEIIPQVVA